MKLSLRRLLVLGGFFLTAPSVAAAQQGGASDTVSPAEAEVEALLTEYQQIHTELEGIQQEALEDPDLNAAQLALGNRIRSAMEAHDPTIAERLQRAEALEGELLAAQQSGDTQRLGELMTEAQAIEEHFITVQQAVVGQAEIASEIGDFQIRLERKMAEVDPGATVLIERFKELETRIEQVIRAGA